MFIGVCFCVSLFMRPFGLHVINIIEIHPMLDINNSLVAGTFRRVGVRLAACWRSGLFISLWILLKRKLVSEMAVSGFVACVKYLMFAFNFLFWVSC